MIALWVILTLELVLILVMRRRMLAQEQTLHALRRELNLRLPYAQRGFVYVPHPSDPTIGVKISDQRLCFPDPPPVDGEVLEPKPDIDEPTSLVEAIARREERGRA